MALGDRLAGAGDAIAFLGVADWHSSLRLEAVVGFAELVACWCRLIKQTEVGFVDEGKV
ncbi:hypothetical protein D3C84_977310 [compost metagenome]